MNSKIDNLVKIHLADNAENIYSSWYRNMIILISAGLFILNFNNNIYSKILSIILIILGIITGIVSTYLYMKKLELFKNNKIAKVLEIKLKNNLIQITSIIILFIYTIILIYLTSLFF